MNLKRHLTPTNIQSGFRSTRIFPLNSNALDSKYKPYQVFVDNIYTPNEDKRKYDDILHEFVEDPHSDVGECSKSDIDVDCDSECEAPRDVVVAQGDDMSS